MVRHVHGEDNVEPTAGERQLLGAPGEEPHCAGAGGGHLPHRVRRLDSHARRAGRLVHGDGVVPRPGADLEHARGRRDARPVDERAHDRRVGAPVLGIRGCEGFVVHERLSIPARAGGARGSVSFGDATHRGRFPFMAIAREAEPITSLREIREAGLDREDLLGAYRNMLITRGDRGARPHRSTSRGRSPARSTRDAATRRPPWASRPPWARTTSARRCTATWASTSRAASSRGGSSRSTWAARTARRGAATATSTWPTRTSG